MPSSLQEFLALLEERKQLVRIREEVDPVLEITEIADRVMKQGGPALLFENVIGSTFPVLINAYGSWKRMAWALDVEDVEQLANKLRELIKTHPPQSFWDKLKVIPKLMEIAKSLPKEVGSGHCQEVVMNEVDLSKLPILKCWPKDGGRFITFPMVITRDPENGIRNVGMYRLQVLDKKTTAMHWQIHKVGSRHYQKYKDRKENVKDAFAVTRHLSLVTGHTVCIVDDVATTGSTIGECAKALRSAGAKKVFAICIARD